jgi:exopolysaccharide biosynthesis polyprenyl glycosylphosphotransferase
MNHGQRVALLVLLALLVTVGRGITRRAIVAVLPPERCLVIGSGEATDELAERFLRSHAFKAEVVDRIQSSPELYSDTWDSTRRFREMVATHKAERIIVIPESAEDLEAARAANGAGLKVSVVPSLLSTIGTSWAIDDLIGLTMLGMRTPRLTDSSRVMKRTFDLILGTVITLVLLPFMLVVAFAIKTGSSGPVIFRQKRVGRDEKEFTMLKFRTMVENADEMRDELRGRNESTGLFKITDDPRVTRVGRILRKTSLDELPQLFNVLRGEMSLVGPRPLILEEDVLLSGWARFRYRVSPGMTGPWQLGSAARFSLSDMASLDYVYVTNWSLWADVKILIRTAVYVVGMRGR